jgi:C_GCAxxG_C_C family probable redox protein
MENKSRREFFAASALIAFNRNLLSESNTQPAQVAAEPSSEELEIIHNSQVAQDLINFLGKGYSCAESGLAVCLRHLGKPEELVWMAGGFGGGLGQKDLCGFLTSGIMAIGLYAGSQNLDRTEAKKLCGQLVKQYWDWWMNTTPIHCGEILNNHHDNRVCVRVGYLAMAKIEELLSGKSQG